MSAEIIHFRITSEISSVFSVKKKKKMKPASKFLIFWDVLCDAGLFSIGASEVGEHWSGRECF